MAIPISFCPCQTPDPENPLYIAASVFKNTFIWPMLIIFEIMPIYMVGITISIFSKIEGENENLPNPADITLFPIEY